MTDFSHTLLQRDLHFNFPQSTHHDRNTFWMNTKMFSKNGLVAMCPQMKLSFSFMFFVYLKFDRWFCKYLLKILECLSPALLRLRSRIRDSHSPKILFIIWPRIQPHQNYGRSWFRHANIFTQRIRSLLSIMYARLGTLLIILGMCARICGDHELILFSKIVLSNFGSLIPCIQTSVIPQVRSLPWFKGFIDST